ncbi:hypothetical protein A2T80_004770 [Aphanizomenon flos-aquae UKL13-PB]|nr:hypothetical protein [Aphanizomenon flos-aquae UKL13-PB]
MSIILENKSIIPFLVEAIALITYNTENAIAPMTQNTGNAIAVHTLLIYIIKPWKGYS